MCVWLAAGATMVSRLPRNPPRARLLKKWAGLLRLNSKSPAHLFFIIFYTGMSLFTNKQLMKKGKRKNLNV